MLTTQRKKLILTRLASDGQIVAGLGTGDSEEAAVKRALHERAAETVVLASSDKLMSASAFVVAALKDVSLLVVPPKTSERTMRALRGGGVKGHLAI